MRERSGFGFGGRWTTLDPNPTCQHWWHELIQDFGQSHCWDLLGLDVALFIFAVAETVPVEEPAGAASALFAPLWALVKVIVCKNYGPSFICKHAEFSMGVLVLDEVPGIVSFLALFLASLVIAWLQFWTFASFMVDGSF